MEKKQKNIDLLENNDEMTKLIDCIHQFSQKLIETKTEEDVLKLLVEDIPRQIGITDYILYKVDLQTRKLKDIASFGNNNFQALQALEKDPSIRAQTGLASIKEAAVTANSEKTSGNNFNIVSLDSEIILPIVSKGVLNAVIIGRYSDQNTFTEPHRKLLESVTSLAGCHMENQRENSEMERIKFQLETLLEKKDADIGNIIDLLSSKNSELKYYNEKQKELIQELHHRVTNNLQTISSIIRLYKYGNQKDSIGALQEIYDRVQILAIIYQNIYKSMERDCTNIESFLHDTISYLKSTSNNTKVEFNLKSNVRGLNYNILISLGLFVAEIFYSWLEKAEKSGIDHIKFNISIKGTDASNALVVSIKDDEKIIIMENLFDMQSTENISDIMISGLVDQLEGEINQGFEEGNFINLQFRS